MIKKGELQTMTTRRDLRKLGKVNKVRITGKTFTLADMVQESYKVAYAAKKTSNQTLISLAESHLVDVKKDPSNLKQLSENLETLQGLVKLGKDQNFKDIEEVEAPKKRRCKNKMSPAVEMKESWQASRNRIGKSLSSFRENSRSKVFFTELGKFNRKLSEGQKITMTEAINLYKASNSCLTHLAVELDRNPGFIKTYKECTSLLSRDNNALLKSIQECKVPDIKVLESFAVFTNILLESDAPEDLDDEIYADVPVEDEDIVEEDELCVDGDCEDLEEDDDYIDDVAPSVEDLEEDDGGITVELTDEEVALLRSILTKVTPLSEEDDPMVDDEIDYEDDIIEEEEEIDVPVDNEELPPESLEDEEEDSLEEDADLEELDDRDVIDEDADMEELEDRDVINEDADMEELDDRDVIDESCGDDEDEEDLKEDADMEELDDRDVIDEDADLEELEDRDVINEDQDVVDDEAEEEESVLSEAAKARIRKGTY